MPTPVMTHVERACRRNRAGSPARWCGRGPRCWPGSRTAAASTTPAVWSISSSRAGDRALHALLLGRQVEGRAIGEHQPAPLERHRFGHDQHQLVALDRGDHGEADAGVARGRLDDRAAGLQRAATSRPSSTIASAMRSLIEPPGLARSLFTHTSWSGNMRARRMCGVLPMVARTLSAFMSRAPCAVIASAGMSGSKVLARRSSGKITAQIAVTTIAPTPPKATAPAAPSSAGQRGPTAARRVRSRRRWRGRRWPRRGRASSSGVLSWTSELRMNTETMSAAPSSASRPSESAKLRDRREGDRRRAERDHRPQHLDADVVLERLPRQPRGDQRRRRPRARRASGRGLRGRPGGCRARTPAASRSRRRAAPRTGRA